MNTFEIAKDGWQALGAGKVVANPAAWKAKQVSVNQVATALGTLVVLAKALGYDFHMDDTTLLYIAGGVYGVVNWLLTVVTTDKIGIMGKPSVAGAAGGSPAGVGAALGAQMGSGPAFSDAPMAVRTDAGSVVEQRATAIPVGGPGTENGGP